MNTAEARAAADELARQVAQHQAELARQAEQNRIADAARAATQPSTP
ncbi:hypothetical protein OG618_37730 (plasmid) [Kitasatospora sp. NBC_01246]|nr:hypothetical protein [Kitasatospora sp. NBC_01246]